MRKFFETDLEEVIRLFDEMNRNILVFFKDLEMFKIRVFIFEKEKDLFDNVLEKEKKVI